MKNWFMVWSLLLIGSSGYSQLIDYGSLSVQHHAYALPGGASFKGPIHPGVELEAGKIIRQGEKSSQLLGLQLGGYYHQAVETGLFLGGSYTYQYRPIQSMGIEGRGSLAYLHSFFPQKLYETNPDTGALEEVSQTGRPHALIGLGLRVSWLPESGWQPFVGYQLRVETPFAVTIPAIPSTALEVGLRYQF